MEAVVLFSGTKDYCALFFTVSGYSKLQVEWKNCKVGMPNYFSQKTIGIRKAQWGRGKVHICMASP